MSLGTCRHDLEVDDCGRTQAPQSKENILVGMDSSLKPGYLAVCFALVGFPVNASNAVQGRAQQFVGEHRKSLICLGILRQCQKGHLYMFLPFFDPYSILDKPNYFDPQRFRVLSLFWW